MQKLAAILTAVLVTGCTAKYTQSDVSTSSNKLDPRQSVIIATPTDGRYAEKLYSGSGEMTANAVRTAFAHYTNQVDVVAACKDITCLKARSASAYYVVPEILHWEDRATEWSGIPDKVQVKLTIYEPTSNEPSRAAVLSGKSKWATFGGDHPQDLLPGLLQNYVKAQY